MDDSSLPRLSPSSNLDPHYQTYLSALKNTRFQGEIRTDYAARLAVATDNSIYQLIPQAVIFPRTTADIGMMLQLAQQELFHTITFSPRGGGTATNGQSLTSGIIIDCSKYLRAILELNLEEQWVRVQSGVVLDQLNTFLQPHGFCFAPEISTSNRATIGGMVNTDACGTGSKILGRTSDHILDLTCVLSDGRILNSSDVQPTDLLYQELQSLLAPRQLAIREKFPNMPRTLSGYNLLKAYTDRLHLNYLFAGSEGTLAIISECQLKITPIPKYKKLIILKYASFAEALRAPEITVDVTPLVIETIDEKLLDLARQDRIYHAIRHMLDGDVAPRAINLVEFVGNDEQDVEKNIQKLCSRSANFYVTKNNDEAKLFWELRKKSVGLISKNQVGTRRPIPFIEDTAVPPEKLADYIAELKLLLDSYSLSYGMYGHIDAGCVHVRPALDLRLINDEKLIREIATQVLQLLQKYHGVLWGEHGMGRRSEFAPQFFGEELYYVIRKIKTLFDPRNQINPGKIAVPLQREESVVSFDSCLRGQFDRQVAPHLQAEFANAMACNGNGACFNYATADVMCPSYKVTQDRIHSPKGRAVLIREWLRQLSSVDFSFKKIGAQNNFLKKIWHSLQNKLGQHDFSNEVRAAMQGCLSCQACTHQCPLSVDIPTFKSQFLNYYYQRYLRSPRDYLIAQLETIVKIQVRFARVNNRLLKMKMMQWFLKYFFHLVDVPLIAKNTVKEMPAFDMHIVANLSAEQRANSVIIVQDAFTSFYEGEVLAQFCKLLEQLGIIYFVVPYFPSGKPLVVNGFLKKYEKIAKKNKNYLQQLARFNIPIVGLDPSITLHFREEALPSIQLVQEWLVTHPKLTAAKISPLEKNNYYLLSHCTEKSACLEAEAHWQKIFAAVGLSLLPLSAGCCGMAGSYGHEVEHQENSKKLFAMDWQCYIDEYPHAEKYIVATGYSCRSQAQRFAGVRLQHPLEILSREIAKISPFEKGGLRGIYSAENPS